MGDWSGWVGDWRREKLSREEGGWVWMRRGMDGRCVENEKSEEQKSQQHQQQHKQHQQQHIQHQQQHKQHQQHQQQPKQHQQQPNFCYC